MLNDSIIVFLVAETDAQVCEIYGNQQYQSKGSLYKKPTVQSGHLQFKFTGE